MTLYRKRGREYYKINGDLVIMVLNKEKQCWIDIADNWVVRDTAIDPQTTTESTEAEFSEQYKYAFDRISLQKLDV